MYLYIVVYDRTDEKFEEAVDLARAALDSAGYDYHEACDNVLVVRAHSDDPAELRDRLKLDSETEYAGFVFLLNGSYTGYYSRDLWSWLREVREKVF